MMVLWIILIEKCLNEILESLKTEDEKMFFLKFEYLKNSMSRLSDLHDDWFLNTKWYLASVILIVFLNLNGLLCIMNGLYKKNAYKQRFYDR